MLIASSVHRPSKMTAFSALIVAGSLAACSYDLPQLAETTASSDSSSSSGGGGAGGSATNGSSSSSSNASSASSSASSSSSSSSSSASSSSSSSSSGGMTNPPVFIQVASTTPQMNQFVAKATYSMAQTAGNTNIVAIGWNDISSNLVSVTDTFGNSYQPALGTFKSATMSQAIYYASNIAAAPAGMNTVIAVFNPQAQYIDLRITEYHGVNAIKPVDTSTSKAGQGDMAMTDMMTTTSNAELLFAAGMTRSSFSSAGMGYTQRTITSPDGDIIEDRMAVMPGTFNATAPLSNNEWLMQLVAFRAGP